MENHQGHFVFFGLLSYFFFCLQGIFLSKFKNPRMALSTHSAGLMIGTYSIAIGSVPHLFTMELTTSQFVCWSHIVGNSLLLAALFLSSCWNTRGMTPIMGGDVEADKGHELIVKIGLQLSSVFICFSLIVLLLNFNF